MTTTGTLIYRSLDDYHAGPIRPSHMLEPAGGRPSAIQVDLEDALWSLNDIRSQGAISLPLAVSLGLTISQYCADYPLVHVHRSQQMHSSLPHYQRATRLHTSCTTT